jgi:hypothetical protein
VTVCLRGFERSCQNGFFFSEFLPEEDLRPDGNWEMVRSEPIGTDDEDNGEFLGTGFERAFQQVGSILEYKLCPPGHQGNPSYCTDGFENARGDMKPYKWWINTMLNRHGCNCFPIKNDAGKLVPAHFAKGKDDLDVACGELANSLHCIEDMAESGNYFKGYECTYNEAYFFYFNPTTKEVVCGKEEDPDYYDSRKGEQRCQRSLCEADLDFADKVVDYLGGPGHKGGLDAKSQRWNNANEWNRRRNTFTCDKTPGQEREVKCCGSKNPWLRKPFNNLTHKCCNSKKDLVKRNTPEVQLVCG